MSFLNTDQVNAIASFVRSPDRSGLKARQLTDFGLITSHLYMRTSKFTLALLGLCVKSILPLYFHEYVDPSARKCGYTAKAAIASPKLTNQSNTNENGTN